MPQPLLSILLYLNHAAKQNQTGPVVCHWCNNRFNLIKYVPKDVFTPGGLPCAL
jgi:hypothetical protein